MFIVTAGGATNPLAPLGPALLLALGAATAVALLIFRRRGIAGPVRVEDRESLDPLIVAMVGGLLAWLLGAALFMHLPLGPSSSPLPAKDAEEARFLIPDILGRLAGVVLIFILLGYFFRQPRRLGLTAGQIFPGAAWGLVGILIALPIVLATQYLWAALCINGVYIHEMLQLMGDVPDRRMRMILLLSVIVIAPLSEEILFRGCLQTLFTGFLSRTMRARSLAPPRWLAVVLTSLLFAAIHPWWSRPPIFVLSVCLGYAYERTGNLWTPIVMHAMFNAAAVANFLTQ